MKGVEDGLIAGISSVKQAHASHPSQKLEISKLNFKLPSLSSPPSLSPSTTTNTSATHPSPSQLRALCIPLAKRNFRIPTASSPTNSRQTPDLSFVSTSTSNVHHPLLPPPRHFNTPNVTFSPLLHLLYSSPRRGTFLLPHLPRREFEVPPEPTFLTSPSSSPPTLPTDSRHPSSRRSSFKRNPMDARRTRCRL